VVEDNPESQEEMVLWLGQLGCSVAAANNGYEAVQATGGGQVFDAILMNCELPIMDGLEATAWIRVNGRTHTPIIGLTANAMGGERKRCLDAGMDDYMSKPAGADDLLDVIRRWVGRNAKALPRAKARAEVRSQSEDRSQGAASEVLRPKLPVLTSVL
jgi:CheY-like chemotaxis protein